MGARDAWGNQCNAHTTHWFPLFTSRGFQPATVQYLDLKPNKDFWSPFPFDKRTTAFANRALPAMRSRSTWPGAVHLGETATAPSAPPTPQAPRSDGAEGIGTCTVHFQPVIATLPKERKRPLWLAEASAKAAQTVADPIHLRETATAPFSKPTTHAPRRVGAEVIDP